MNQPPSGDGHHEVRTEETKLNQHGLRVVQLENVLQMGNQYIVEAANKPPHKKQGRQRKKCKSMFRRRNGWTDLCTHALLR